MAQQAGCVQDDIASLQACKPLLLPLSSPGRYCKQTGGRLREPELLTCPLLGRPRARPPTAARRRWFHGGCVGMSEEDMEAIGGGSPWACPGCCEC